MNWEKSGKNYTVKCNGSSTTFNLDGLAIKQECMTQDQANSFLNINGYQSFKVNVVVKKVKKTTLPAEL